MAATATASRPARKSASSASKRDRSRHSASRPRSAASGARSNTATAKTATADRAAGYVGRFAPSPTGPLHVGSLTTAVASYLEARRNHGRWLVRIENLDTPRIVPGMADEHLRVLDTLGFEWDGAVRWQSAHTEDHRAAFERLQRQDAVYACTCSRAELAAGRPALPEDDEDEHPYPGHCRSGPRAPDRVPAWRLRVPDEEMGFVDRWQGHVRERLAASSGDFIVVRRDGVTAYQLAVVVDDALQAVTDVVRGADLLSSTARQIHLQAALDLPTPSYAHAPLVVGPDGAKLAKSRAAIALDGHLPARELVRALTLLGQAPPAELARGSANECWRWAEANWNGDVLKNMRSTLLKE